jgi:hypothetical protein
MNKASYILNMILMLICIILTLMCSILWTNHPHSITFSELVNDYGIKYESFTLDTVITQVPIIINQKEIKYEYIQKEIIEYVKTTETLIDTIEVRIPVPIITKVLEDEYRTNNAHVRYKITYSGHKPEIDSVEILEYTYMFPLRGYRVKPRNSWETHVFVNSEVGNRVVSFKNENR